MFKTLQKEWGKDKDLPDRAFRLSTLTKVIDGTIYDCLKHDFFEESADNGEYIPIRARRPSVRYRLCRLVVDDTASLLFSEGHFPSPECDDEAAKENLELLLATLPLNDVLVDAVTRGSVGSVAILLHVLDNRAFLTVMQTAYLTPTWKPTAPDTLLKVTERYKVRGQTLIDAGYAVEKENSLYWWQRDWTETDETFYIPLEVSPDADKQTPKRDATRSTTHNLGFVPMVWIRNLPGGDTTDGACTFPDEAIDTNIELDYQLSQAGRGLKYSSDPTLLIKEPAVGENGKMIKGAGNAIVVSADGDAKMLEINGTAVEAVINYVRLLRELALESMHGNRANVEKSMSAPSGKALEMLNQSLIWLTDKLRVSYGENGLKTLIAMVIAAHAKIPLKTKTGKTIPEISVDTQVSLRWPPWYAPTLTDMGERADTLVKLTDGGLLSRETAIKVLSAEYDIEDSKAEKLLADADMAQRNAEAQKQVKITE